MTLKDIQTNLIQRADEIYSKVLYYRKQFAVARSSDRAAFYANKLTWYEACHCELLRTCALLEQTIAKAENQKD